jgi:hypothetical protein
MITKVRSLITWIPRTINMVRLVRRSAKISPGVADRQVRARRPIEFALTSSEATELHGSAVALSATDASDHQIINELRDRSGNNIETVLGAIQLCLLDGRGLELGVDNRALRILEALAEDREVTPPSEEEDRQIRAVSVIASLDLPDAVDLLSFRYQEIRSLVAEADKRRKTADMCDRQDRAGYRDWCIESLDRLLASPLASGDPLLSSHRVRWVLYRRIISS